MAEGIGRIRRVYVRPAWRNQGIGQALVHTLVENARTSSPPCTFAPIIPRQLGFTSVWLYTQQSGLNATHVLDFDSTAYAAPMNSGESGG